jgi:hypothetical protein
LQKLIVTSREHDFYLKYHHVASRKKKQRVSWLQTHHETLSIYFLLIELRFSTFYQHPLFNMSCLPLLATLINQHSSEY